MTLRIVTLTITALFVLPAALLAIATPAAAEGPTVTQVTITSFDGTRLAATHFSPDGADDDNRVPYVLMTHGWAGSRTAAATGRVADLLAAGYGVLTWDSRGFGQSTGEVQLNSVDYEVKDVKVLITWLVANAPVAMEGSDPVIGMSGGSYAGAIQLLSSAFDSRIDAIAPEIAWNDLVQSLGPNGVPKLYWTSLLFGGGLATSCSAGHSLSLTPSGCQTSALTRYYAAVHATNSIPPDVAQALTARSPATYMDQIQVPTLLIQGFPDTLFDVDQAVANYNGIKANGQPVKLWLYDGGHSGPNTQSSLISGVVINWFDCHLKVVADCTDVGAEVDYFTSGVWRSAPSWPLDQTAHNLSFGGIPTLTMAPVATGGQGSWNLVLENGPALGSKIATGGANITAKFRTSAGDGVIFASIGVMDAAGKVTRIGDQTSPARIPAGAATSITIDLVDVTAALNPGEKLVMTLATADQNYNSARSVALVSVTDITVAWNSRAG